MLAKEQQTLLVLMQNALWNHKPPMEATDWDKLENIAEQQGVFSLLYWGAKAYKALIPSEKLRSWRARMISTVAWNADVNEIQNQVLQLLDRHHIRAVILKGVSCSKYYPSFEMRALGDIDILVDKDKMLVVDGCLKDGGFCSSGEEHPVHIGYCKNGITVEIHFEATEYPVSLGGKIAQKYAKSFLDEVRTVTEDGMSFPVLSDSHQALMLLMHMEKHLLISGIGLRQLCDWATFVYGVPQEHWYTETFSMLETCGLMTFAKVITKVCVKYLGLDEEKASWCMEVKDEVAQRMIQDIFRSGNMGSAEDDHTASLFFDRMDLGDKKQTRIHGLIAHLNQLSYRHFPFTKEYRFLLPLFWAYIPCRYYVRSLLGLRPKKNVVKLLEVSKKKQELYKALGIYKIVNKQ